MPILKKSAQDAGAFVPNDAIAAQPVDGKSKLVEEEWAT